jgi:prepilin-type N-terminal cleavage/methylation domain-containing protein/prepilin-type processing-associated H-X9-DG protein
MNHRQRIGFTLIELLVVVAIIAILAAMLLPTLRNAQEASRSSKCLSNLRQIIYAVGMYQQDNDERFPGWYAYEYDSGGTLIAAPSWCTYIARQVPGMDTKGMAHRDQNVFHCPTIAKTLNVYNISTLTVWTWPTVYTANINLLGNGVPPVKLSQVKNPMETVFCGDSRIEFLSSRIWEPALVYPSELDPDPAVNPGTRGIGRVHNKKGNVVYVDGHAAGFVGKILGTTYP